MSYQSLLSLVKKLDKKESLLNNESNAVQALDAILTQSFFAATVLTSQHPFWNSLGFDAEHESYCAEEYNEASFNKLQQEAATQRVRLSMRLVSDDVLINMLRHNKQECCEYLKQLHDKDEGVDILPLSFFENAPYLILDDLLANEAEAQFFSRMSKIIDTYIPFSELQSYLDIDDLTQFKQNWIKQLDIDSQSNDWLDATFMQKIQAKLRSRAEELTSKSSTAASSDSPGSAPVSFPAIYSSPYRPPYENALRKPARPENGKQDTIKLENDFATLQRQQEDLWKTASIMQSLADIKEGNFVFDHYIKKESASFDTAVSQTKQELSLIVNQLEGNNFLLNKLLNSIARDNNEQIINKLLAAQAQWLKQFEECKTTRDQLTGALSELEHIRTKKEFYLFTNRELTARAISESELQETRCNKKITSAPLTDEQIQCVTAGTENKPNDIVKKSPFAKHTLYTFTESLGGTRNATGFFVQTIDREHPTNGIPVSKVELLQPPVEVGADEKGKEKIYDVPMHTKVNLYFDMALALLVAEEGRAPTKERPIYISNGTAEQQEWIWTALVLLGEKKFNFSADALVVNGRLFSPEQVKSKSWFCADDYKSNSIYKQIHNNPQAKDALDAKIEEADKISAKGANGEMQAKNAIKSIGHFREKVQQLKPSVEQNQNSVQTNARTMQ